MLSKTPPPIAIIDRAVEVWKGLLADPKYDNMGDTGSEEERRPNLLAGRFAASIPSNATPERLTKFGDALKALLCAPDGSGHYTTSMHVDYHPDRVLAQAAESAGLEMQFPWKTFVRMTGEYVESSNGYGAKHSFHYPTPGGGWRVMGKKDSA